MDRAVNMSRDDEFRVELAIAYQSMAADETRETEALEWVEAMIWFEAQDHAGSSSSDEMWYPD
jgi:hypothetical protein